MFDVNDFIISDHHFGHRRMATHFRAGLLPADIAELADDPVKAMDLYLIGAHNSTVAPNDTTGFLGDFSFLNNQDTAEILEAMHGHKVLVRGNHDRARSRSWWLKAGMDMVVDGPVHANIGGLHVILSHEPVDKPQRIPALNLHGHEHTRKDCGPYRINMVAEHHDFVPRRIGNIVMGWAGRAFPQKEVA